jgi:hypothetical protein
MQDAVSSHVAICLDSRSNAILIHEPSDDGSSLTVPSRAAAFIVYKMAKHYFHDGADQLLPKKR